MAQRRRRKGKRARVTKRQLIVVLVVSTLFLVCLVVDCGRRGLFQQKKAVRQELGSEKVENSKPVKSRDDNRIRVLLTENGIYHSTVSVIGTKTMTVKMGSRTSSYAKGKTLSLSLEDVKASGKKVTVTCPDGRLRVTSIQKGGRRPSYRGSIRIVWNKNGILLINELSLREYLYCVVPSEMPSSYPLEALKAQAVCARSFAWAQMKSDSYKKYGADVDDTTAFQVYNNIGENKQSRRAVDSTAGEMVCSGNRVITTYYYSTSWGCSATAQEAWGGENRISLYPCRLQSDSSKGDASPDLSDETAFYRFMTGDGDTYDAGSDWYRWSMRISAKQLGARLGIGKVKKLLILERGKSGLLKRVRAVGSRGRLTLEGQEEIRQYLMVPGIQIERKKNGDKTTLSMLPSAAFLVNDGVKDGEVVFTLLGGGLGHGVGMSQNGAADMAKQGKNYRQILKHYYSHSEVRSQASP